MTTDKHSALKFKMVQGLAFTALLGMGAWFYQNRDNDTYEDRFKYDETFSKQDSAYSVRMAEAVYAYMKDQMCEAPRIVHEANGETYADLLKKDLTFYYHLGQAAGFDEGKSGGTVFTVNRLRNVARQSKKDIVVLRDKDDPDKAVYIDTSGLKDLQDRADACAKKENVPALPVKFVMCEASNAKVALDYYNPMCISYTLSTLRDHDKTVALGIMSHEYRHVGHMYNGHHYSDYDLHGHESDISYHVKEQVSEEGDCDVAQARSPGFDAYALAGQAYFDLTGWIAPEELVKIRSSKPKDGIKKLAAEIFEINKRQIKTMGTHPPALYRFVNMGKEAGIDIEQYAERFERRNYDQMMRSLEQP